MNYDTAQEMFDALCQPFPADEIEWRIGSTSRDKSKCLPLAYIDARTVADRLDSFVGCDNWQCNYTAGVNGSIVCNLGIRMSGGEWIWKADGAGATDIEGEKGALSDAFKRAAVRWGIGRYLYDIKAPWVPLEDGKRIPDIERKRLTEFYIEFAQSCGWGGRPGSQVYRLLAKVMKDYVTDPATAQEFKTKNEGEIALLPVAMRRNLLERLDRVGATQMEAAE
jgi:hypothetical protein